MSENYRVAIIGGGIVGCSILYWLAKLGWRDIALIERRELTSGSTWHAAGNTTFFGHYPAITRLFVNSVKTYLDAEKESGQPVGFHSTGSLRLATSPGELEYYHNLEPVYADLDIPYRVVANEEIQALHPLLETEGLFGAAHTPTDGYVDPTGATQAMAKAAKARGATIKRWCPVTRVEPNSGRWKISTSDGDLQAEHVVLATSFWTRELVQNLGLNLPLYALQHQEIISGPAAELEALEFELPTVRDPIAPSNTRQEGDGFLCGVYESDPQPWAIDGIPGDFTEELLPPELDRLEPHLLRVIERLPAFGNAGIKTVNNGPICYTPDGLPLLGPVESHRGLWLAAGFTIGIGTGGGSGEFLARWIHSGSPDVDLPVVYPSRFSNEMTREGSLEMIRNTYAKGYAISEPPRIN